MQSPLARDVHLILGSSSKFRARIFQSRFGEGFSTVSPDIDERDPALRCADPQLLVRRIAEAKSDHLCQQQRDWLLAQGGEHSTGRVLLVTGDQVVVFQGQVREKPEGVQEARQFLSSYGGDCVSTVAAVCVTEVGTGLRRTDTDTVTLQFGDIPADCIDALVADPDILTSAGALIMEHPMMNPHIVSIDGTEDSVQGLPLDLLERLIGEILDLSADPTGEKEKALP